MANMTNSEFSKLLTSTAKAALKHQILLSKVNSECRARYGTSYSDIDADCIIDILDLLGGNSFTEDEFNKAMEDAGATRIDLEIKALQRKRNLTEKELSHLAELERKLDSV